MQAVHLLARLPPLRQVVVEGLCLKVRLGPTLHRDAHGLLDIDIESEDSDDDASTRSTSVATPGRPLTARQAVLRNVVDATHVSLSTSLWSKPVDILNARITLGEPPNPRKKKPLTEIEMALKREETARKRRNLSEKKLEDEKVCFRGFT